MHRLLLQQQQLKGSAYALRKVVFLLAFASALTAEQLRLLVDSVRSYGEAFVKDNEEAPAQAPQAKVLIQEIN